MKATKKSVGLAIVMCLVLVGMVGCIAGVSTFFAEDRNPVSRLSMIGAKDIPATRLEIDTAVVGADPLRGLIKVELSFRPMGDLVEGERRRLTRDITLHTNGTGKGDIVLKKGHQAHPIEIAVNLLDGDFGLYPFDVYHANIQIEAPTGPGNEAPLPLIVNFQSHNHQLHADAVLDADSSFNDLLVDLTLVRPVTVKGFAVFMNLVILFIGLAAAVVTFNVSYRGRKMEISLMVWMGALLFVMPGIRNLMPGTPPMGSLTDFLIFFWVEAALALCLCIMVATWYGRAPMDK